MPPPPVSIIFDTDMSIDVDDVGALCVIHALQDRGEAELLAVVHGTGLPAGIGAVPLRQRGVVGMPRQTGSSVPSGCLCVWLTMTTMTMTMMRYEFGA